MLNIQDKSSVAIVGYKDATITQEFAWWIGKYSPVTIVEPDNLILDDSCAYIVSITRDKQKRNVVINQLQGQAFATFIHDTVVTHGDFKIGKGSFVGPNASIYFDAVIGPHCIIGPYSMISHRACIGTSTILHPGTMIAGTTNIGSNCLLGMRSTVLDKITICDNVVIGAGAMITKDISAPGHYVGSPARKVS